MQPVFPTPSEAAGKSRFKGVFSSTGALAFAGFAAFIIDAQPRVDVLLNFSAASSGEVKIVDLPRLRRVFF